ncbi:ATP-grasp domain-containing protein [Streptomyces sp. NPDC049879]|uniref:ATP-grasp domain-containing protein n=1 Tax=Streptomyces sp. NPDC049879 TaxID=3365598 RepID=UPI0037BCA7FD
MTVPVLHCADPLAPRRPDPHFAAEAAASRACGARVALIDHDALLAGDAERAVARVPAGFGTAWYRGWMIPADRYAALDAALAGRGAALLVGPEAYRAAHELPGWYAAFEGLTPHGVWLPSAPGEVPSAGALAALAAGLPPGPGIVKDYVKSRKHEWDEACYLPDLRDTPGVLRVVRRFVELQDDFLAGGVVLRAFESFTRPDGAAHEVRVWWLDGEPVLVTPHPDSPVEAVRAPALDAVRAAVRALGPRWVTTDLALRADGAWRVVEVGDGQVSDLHPSVAPESMAAVLAGAPPAVQT